MSVFVLRLKRNEASCSAWLIYSHSPSQTISSESEDLEQKKYNNIAYLSEMQRTRATANLVNAFAPFPIFPLAMRLIWRPCTLVLKTLNKETPFKTFRLFNYSEQIPRRIELQYREGPRSFYYSWKLVSL